MNWACLEIGSKLGSFRPQVSATLARAAQQLSSQPHKSFSRCLGESLRKSCAAHLSGESMSPDVLLANHYTQTQARIASSESRDILVAQDTVFFNYTGQKQMQGLMPLQDHVLGIVQHNALCIEASSGLPLGLISLHNWTRTGHQDIYEAESAKWLPALVQLNEYARQQPDKRYFLIQDRESDWFDFLKHPRQDNVYLINRIFQNRAFEFIDKDRQVVRVDYLNNIIGSTPVLGTTVVSVQKGNRRVNMTLELCHRRVRVYPPGNKSPRKHKTEELSLVVAREIAAHDQQGRDLYNPDKIAQWVLLSDLKADSLADAILIAQYYARRWMVERLHYTIKSGALHAEQLQFDDVATLCNALALYTLVAWRLLLLSTAARLKEHQDVEAFFDPLELDILQTYAQQAITSTSQAVQVLGKIVGFVPRKDQPLPGIKILAQALLALQNIKSFAVKSKAPPKPRRD